MARAATLMDAIGAGSSDGSGWTHDEAVRSACRHAGCVRFGSACSEAVMMGCTRTVVWSGEQDKRRRLVASSRMRCRRQAVWYEKGRQNMGTWGKGPFENDRAADMVAGMTKYVHRVLEAKTDGTAREHYAEARAAGQFILAAHGKDVLGGPSILDVLQALARMRSDSEWMGEWKAPPKLAAVLDHEMDEVVMTMRLCKRCKRESCEAADKFVASAKSHPVPAHRQSTRSRKKRVTKGKVQRLNGAKRGRKRRAR